LNLSCTGLCDWWKANGTNDAPRIYQDVAGDAVFQTHLPNNLTSTNHWTGIFISDNATSNDTSNTYIAEGESNNLCYETIPVACTGATEPSDSASSYYFKIAKSGTTYAFYYSNDESAWADLGTFTSSSIVSWGLMMKNWGGGYVDGQFNFVFERQYNAVEPTEVWGAEMAVP
jgi:hypothetical protein